MRLRSNDIRTSNDGGFRFLHETLGRRQWHSDLL